VRQAQPDDEETIWQIVHQAALDMVSKGRQQWSAHYPTQGHIHEDILSGTGYVVEDQGNVVAYTAITFEGEPVYDMLKGNWLTTGAYATIHRTAVARQHQGRGLSRLLYDYAEQLCHEKLVGAIRVDTNYDNVEMLHRLEKLGYTRCGLCYYIRNGRPTERIAFEKVV
jgi:GNAT superfamily N-acetyltransferase